MNKITKIHVFTKTVWQIFLVVIEIGIIAGGITWFSSCFWGFESGLDVLERFFLFYGMYQLLVFIILSNVNDIKSDEYLALTSTATLASKVCEFSDENMKAFVKQTISQLLDNGVFNDCVVREKYNKLLHLIDINNRKEIEYMIIWANHCSDEAKLQWKYSFILRLFK